MIKIVIENLLELRGTWGICLTNSFNCEGNNLEGLESSLLAVLAVYWIFDRLKIKTHNENKLRSLSHRLSNKKVVGLILHCSEVSTLDSKIPKAKPNYNEDIQKNPKV